MSHKYGPLYDLKGCSVLGKRVDEKTGRTIIGLKAYGCRKVQNGEERCPGCHVHRTDHIKMIHMPRVEWQVSKAELELTCLECPDGTRHRDWPESLLPNWKMSRTNFAELVVACMKEPRAFVASLFGLPKQMVADVAQAVQEDLQRNYVPKTPRYLGIDGVEVVGLGVCVTVADVENSRIVEFLQGSPGKELPSLLRRLAENGEIKGVVIDPSPELRKIITECLPNVPIIAHRWHIEKHFVKAMLAVRSHLRPELPLSLDRPDENPGGRRRDGLIRLAMGRWGQMGEIRQKKLESAFQYPEFKDAFWAKEAMFRFYENAVGSRAQREKVLDKALSIITPHYLNPYSLNARGLAGAEWREEVLNYHDHEKLTNGFVESINRRIKARAARSGNNASYAEIRAWALGQYGAYDEAMVRACVERIATQKRYSSQRAKIREQESSKGAAKS